MIRRKIQNTLDGANTSAKRKVEDDAYAALEENIKRFRITHTPGELRLSKDVKGMGELSFVQCVFAEDPSTLLLNFQDNSFDGNAIPTKFMIKVSKYYPHQSPVVTCLQSEFSASFIGPDKELIHSSLQIGWSALGTIKTVIDIIQSMRPFFVLSNRAASYGDGVVTPIASKLHNGVSNDMVLSPDCLNMEC